MVDIYTLGSCPACTSNLPSVLQFYPTADEKHPPSSRKGVQAVGRAKPRLTIYRPLSVRRQMKISPPSAECRALPD